MQPVLHDLRRSLPLAVELARRNIAAQYRQSLTGVLQAFFPAIVTTAWCTLVRHTRVIQVESLETPYPAFVLISMMLWLTFVDALQAPIQALLSDQSLLQNSSIPRETVVFGSLGVVGFNFVVKVILVVAAGIWFRLPISATIVLAPLGVLALIGLGTAIGLILAPLNYLYRDIARSLQPMLTFWFFLTPVLFPVPDTSSLAWIVRLNPVTPLLVSTREWITLGDSSQSAEFLLTVPLVCVLFTGGMLFYRVATPIVLERGG